jgi:small subunit ribosomal protein S1
VKSPEEIVKPGQEIDVYVLKVDRENLKIALSLRRLQPEPWDEVQKKYAVGQLVRGTITKLANFGAFARLDGGIEGLIHVSELSHAVIKHPREVVQEGMEMELKIIRIEPERRRLGLSLKQLLPGGEEATTEAPAEGDPLDDDLGFQEIFEKSR